MLVVGDEGEVPEVVDTHGAEQDVGVVSLVVMADPGSDESPEGLDSWVSSESRHFLWLSSCKVHRESKIILFGTYQALVCSRGFLERVWQ